MISIVSFLFFGALALASCVYVYQRWAIEQDRHFAAFLACVIIVLAFFFLMLDVFDLIYALSVVN
jgi:ABC-type Fe3+ transport system permease subunit